jgi:hypothetical protein
MGDYHGLYMQWLRVSLLICEISSGLSDPCSLIPLLELRDGRGMDVDALILGRLDAAAYYPFILIPSLVF